MKIILGKCHETEAGAWLVLTFWAHLKLAVLIVAVLIIKAMHIIYIHGRTHINNIF